MQKYELLFILPGTLGDADVAPVVESVRAAITEKGGTILSLEDMGKSRLAYPMRHIRYGYFRLCRFEAGSAEAVEIQKKLRLMKELLRVLVTKVDERNVGMNTIQFAPIQQERPEGMEMPVPEKIRPMEKAEVAAPAEDKRVKLEDIDKKLDEILEKDIASQL